MTAVRSMMRLMVGIALVATAAGCGLKGDPLPPLIRVADTTRDLAVLQQGNEAILTWSYPSITTAGGPLPDVEKLEVWRTTMPVGLEPQETSHRDRAIRYQLLEAQGEVLESLDTAGMDAATRGSMLQIRDDLASWRSIHGTEQDWIIWYAVRTICCRGRPSAFSNIARLEPQMPPAPLQELAVSPQADGVRMTWRTEAELNAIVERAPAKGDWVVVTPEPLPDGEWLDGGAEQGRRWRYRLRSVRVLADGSRIIGDPGEIVKINYRDVYPPAAPSNIVCLPEAQRVRIRWLSSDAAAWYRVERRLAGGRWERVAERHIEVEFEDTDPPTGSITYSVRAIDGSGNTSERATCDALIGGLPDE